MRLDHLLSREKMLLGTAAYFPESGEWRERSRMLFNFEGSERDSREIWGCSSAGRASALHAEGQEFEPPHLHHAEESAGTSEQKTKHGRIAQVVRAHA